MSVYSGDPTKAEIRVARLAMSWVGRSVIVTEVDESVPGIDDNDLALVSEVIHKLSTKAKPPVFIIDDVYRFIYTSLNGASFALIDGSTVTLVVDGEVNEVFDV